MTIYDDFHDARNIRRDIEVVFLTGLLPQCIIGVVTDYSMIDDEFLVRIREPEYDEIINVQISNSGLIKRFYNFITGDCELTDIEINVSYLFWNTNPKSVVYKFDFPSAHRWHGRSKCYQCCIWWKTQDIFKYLTCGYIAPELQHGIKYMIERSVLDDDECNRIARLTVSTVIDSFIWPKLAAVQPL